MVTIGNPIKRMERITKLSLDFSKKFMEEVNPDESEIIYLIGTMNAELKFLYENSHKRVKEKMLKDNLIKINSK